jgi:preprotein translocase subunit SecF
MRFLKGTTKFDFMSLGTAALVISIILNVLSIVSLATRGLNFGLDFTGGTLIEVTYPAPPSIGDVRQHLAAAGMPDSVVQTFGTASDIVVRIPPRDEGESSADISTLVLKALQQGVEGEIVMRRVEFVGPQVGDDLTEQGILAVIYSLAGIFLYLMFRFQWRFSVGAVVATIHDVFVCMGFLSVFQVEFDLTAVAALLAVIGYSVNDTVVVFDRIRENFARMPKALPRDVINASINQTLSRTLMMSLTVLLTLIALYLFGGKILHSFSVTLIVGVVIGTYSSIYIASAALLYLGISKYDLMPVQKEGATAAVDSRP